MRKRYGFIYVDRQNDGSGSFRRLKKIVLNIINKLSSLMVKTLNIDLSSNDFKPLQVTIVI